VSFLQFHFSYGSVFEVSGSILSSGNKLSVSARIVSNLNRATDVARISGLADLRSHRFGLNRHADAIPVHIIWREFNGEFR